MAECFGHSARREKPESFLLGRSLAVGCETKEQSHLQFCSLWGVCPAHWWQSGLLSWHQHACGWLRCHPVVTCRPAPPTSIQQLSKHGKRAREYCPGYSSYLSIRRSKMLGLWAYSWVDPTPSVLHCGWRTQGRRGNQNSEPTLNDGLEKGLEPEAMAGCSTTARWDHGHLAGCAPSAGVPVTLGCYTRSGVTENSSP